MGRALFCLCHDRASARRSRNPGFSIRPVRSSSCCAWRCEGRFGSSLRHCLIHRYVEIMKSCLCLFPSSLKDCDVFLLMDLHRLSRSDHHEDQHRQIQGPVTWVPTQAPAQTHCKYAEPQRANSYMMSMHTPVWMCSAVVQIDLLRDLKPFLLEIEES